jgi:hypothetical protein
MGRLEATTRGAREGSMEMENQRIGLIPTGMAVAVILLLLFEAFAMWHQFSADPY